MKKHRIAALFTSITCGILACTSGVSQPLGVYAATQGKYISDLVVITAGQEENIKNQGYKILATPLAYLNEQYKPLTYLAYKTTNVANEAITEMKFMSMNDGWDFTTYNDYITSLKEEASRMASLIYPAIEGYRHFLQKGTVQAKFAKDNLNIFYFDENEGLENGKASNKIKLGDLFENPSYITSAESPILQTLFFECNQNILDIVLDTLSIANSRNDEGENFVEQYQKIKDNPSVYIDQTSFNDILKNYYTDIEMIRENINYYENEAEVKREDFSDPSLADFYAISLAEQDARDGTYYADMWENGCSQLALLKSIEYHGIDLEGCETLYDLVMNEDAEDYHYYPLIACLTSGQRTLSFAGFCQTLINGLLDEEKYYDRINMLKESEAHKKLIDDGISCFYGVDRALYQEGNVAMTMDAEFGAAKGDDSWKETNSYNNKFKDNLTRNVYFWLGVATGGYLFIGTPIICKGLYNTILSSELREMTISTGSIAKPIEIFCPLEEDIEAVVVNGVTKATDGITSLPAGYVLSETAAPPALNGTYITQEAAETIYESMANGNRPMYNNLTNVSLQSTKMTAASLRILTASLIIVAVIAFVVTLALFLVDYFTHKTPHYAKYLDVPGILCHYQHVYDPERNMRDKPTNEYVYYYGAINPFGVRTRAEYGNEDDGTFELGENKRSVQDLFNWNLGAGKHREWGCIYFTKDRRAGYPILTSTLKLLGVSKCGGKTGMTNFNDPDVLADYTNKLRRDDNFDGGSCSDDPYRICYDHDPKARYTNSDKDTIISTLGSTVGNVATWGIALIAMVVGVGIGFGIFKLAAKHKNKKEAKED